MLSCMLESLYLEFGTGQIIEVLPKARSRWVLEGAEITRPPGDLPGDYSLVIGDPEGAWSEHVTAIAELIAAGAALVRA